MAQFDADIRLNVILEGLDRGLKQVEKAVNKIENRKINFGDFGFNQKLVGQIDKTVAGVKRLAAVLKGGFAAGGLGTIAVILKDLEKVRGIGGIIKSALGPIDGLTNSLGNFAEAVGQAAASAPELAIGITAAAAAAVAFSPQLADVLKQLGRVPAAVKNVNKGFQQAFNTVALFAFADSLQENVQYVDQWEKKIFRALDTVGRLRERLDGLKKGLDAQNSASEGAAKTAAKYVEIQRRLNDELREQADLLRRASGVNVTELEAAKGRKSAETRGRAESFRSNQARENAAVQASLERLEEAERELNNARLDQRAEQIAIQNEKKLRAENNETIKALERRAQLEERIANQRSARIARENRERAQFLRGNPNQFAEGAVGPQSGAFAAQRASVEQAKQRFALQSNITKALAGQSFQYRVQLELLRRAAKIGAQITADTREQEKIQRRLNRELRVKRGKDLRDRRKDAITNATIGGAFPLLFGQGIGTSLLGAAGGFGGGLLGGQAGFAGSLVGSALGAGFDNFTQQAQDLAVALDTAGDSTQALEGIIGRLDTTLSAQLTNLAQSGQAGAAADLAFKELAKTLGTDAAAATVQAGRDFDAIGKLWTQLTSTLYAGFAQFFQEALYLNLNVDPRTGQPRREGPELTSVATRAQDRATGDLEIARLLTKETQASIDKDIDKVASLQKVRAEREADLEKIIIGNDLEDKKITNQEAITRNLEVEEKLQRELLQIDQRRVDAVAARAKEQERAAERARRERERAARRAAREAERAAREAERERLRVFTGLNTAAVKALDLASQVAELDKGSIFSIDTQLQFLERRRGYEEANIIAKEKDAQLQQLLLSNLQQEYAIKERLLYIQRAQLQLERERTLEVLRRQQADSAQATNSEVQRLQAEIANPFGGEALEQELQRIDQVNRRYTELGTIQRDIADTENDLRIRGNSLNKEERKLLNDKLALQKVFLAQRTKELDQLDMYEQKLLRQNQILEKYGFIVDSVASGLSDAIVGAIKGTETVEQAFARMFENIGKAFIDMATKMLAQQAFLSILQAFTSGGTGGGSAGKGIASAASALTPRAAGGPMSPGRPYVVGERGPELVLPNTSSNVLSANAFDAAKQAMSTSSAVQSSTAALDMEQQQIEAMQNPAPIDIRYDSTVINNTTYVTEEQMLESNRRAVKEARARVFSDMRNKPGTRTQLGMA